MRVESLFFVLAIGVAAGWLGGNFVKGYGLGLAIVMIVGVAGAFIGAWLFSTFHFVSGAGFVGDLMGASVGAVALLLALRLLRRRVSRNT